MGCPMLREWNLKHSLALAAHLNFQGKQTALTEISLACSGDSTQRPVIKRKFRSRGPHHTVGTHRRPACQSRQVAQSRKRAGAYVPPGFGETETRSKQAAQNRTKGEGLLGLSHAARKDKQPREQKLGGPTEVTACLQHSGLPCKVHTDTHTHSRACSFKRGECHSCTPPCMGVHASKTSAAKTHPRRPHGRFVRCVLRQREVIGPDKGAALLLCLQSIHELGHQFPDLHWRDNKDAATEALVG
eukprot:1158281-Pelagomonas_calceolata.AAC.12